jgi:hypothetical protein
LVWYPTGVVKAVEAANATARYCDGTDHEPGDRFDEQQRHHDPDGRDVEKISVWILYRPVRGAVFVAFDRRVTASFESLPAVASRYCSRLPLVAVRFSEALTSFEPR